MKKPVVLLILLFLSTPGAGAQTALEKAEKAWAQSPVHELTWLGRWVERKIQIPSGASDLSRNELIFLKNNPDAYLVIQNSACRALAISYTLCGVKPVNEEIPRAWDEEADAVRHFVFSSFLTCSRGRKFAEAYTLAHEGPPPWVGSEEMDINNNEAGMSWAQQPGRCHLQMGDDSVARAALKALQAGKLMTLRDGDTRCTQPQSLLQQDWSAFSQKVNQTQIELGKVVSLCRVGPKKNESPAPGQTSPP